MAKIDTGAIAHYFIQADAHALVNIQTTNMGTQIRLPGNSTMDPEQLGHLPLLPLPDTSQIYDVSVLKMHL